MKLTKTRGAAAVLLSGAIALPQAAAAAERWIVSTGFPPGHFAVTQGIEPWMACVRAGTNGAIDFDFFPSGQIAAHQASLDAINNGLAQVAYLQLTNFSDRMPLTMMTMLPDMGDNVTQMVGAYGKVLAEDTPFRAEMTGNNVQPLFLHIFPPYQIGVKGDPVTTLEQFHNLKIRVAGGAQTFAVQSLHAVPVQIAAGDTYVATQQGTVDAYMLPLASIESYKLQEVSRAISTNASFASATSMLAMDSRVFAAQSPEVRAVLTDCGSQVTVSLAAYSDQQTRDLVKKFGDLGVTMYEFAPDDLAKINGALQAAADDLIKRLTDLGQPAKQAYDTYRAALGK